MCGKCPPSLFDARVKPAAHKAAISSKARIRFRAAIPPITLEGDANGAPHPRPEIDAKKFSGRYALRLITGGSGHNLLQEAPQAFAHAVIDVDGL
jgi:hypothetical protein